MMFLNDENVDLEGFTTIIPCVGVGNVAQLSIDLIIATLELKRLGNGYHKACIPLFGPSAYKHDEHNQATAFEIYWNQEKKFLVFQMRSPLVSAFQDDFHQDMLEFLINKKILKVIILTSSHAYEQHSPSSPAYQCIQNDKYKNLQTSSALPWHEYEGTVIYGGGNAKKLLNCCTIKGMAGILLFKYVSEGDNSEDASQLVMEINKIVELFEDSNSDIELIRPSSWNFLFGNKAPDLIF